MKSLALALWVVVQSPTSEVERWDTHEIVLAASGDYSHTNPFLSVDLTATFVHTGGTQIAVRGFHDGNGVGGQSGNVWKVRFMPTLEGDWTWVTSSNDPGLDAQWGTLTATAPASDNHGPLARSAPPHLHLPNADGTHTFLFGLWVDPYQWGETEKQAMYEYLEDNRVTRIYTYSGYANEKFALPDFQTYRIPHFFELDQTVRDCLARGIHMNLYLYTNDWEVQQGMLDMHDAPYVEYMMARYACFRNVEIHLTNQVDWHYRGWGSLQADRLASMKWGDALGAYAASLNPFGLLMTTHHPGEDGDRNVGGAWFLPEVDQWAFGQWSGYIQKQVQVTALSEAQTMTEVEPYANELNERGLARLNQMVETLRETHEQPVHVDEFSFECDPAWNTPVVCKLSWKALSQTGTRKAFWTTTASACSGVTALIGSYELVNQGLLGVPTLQARGTLGQARLIADTMVGLPFWEMAPAGGLVSGLPVTIDGAPWRSTFCIAKPGVAYLVYLVNGGEGSIFLAPGAYDVWRVNPRTGVKASLGVVSGGGVSFAVPESHPAGGNHNGGDTDWILLYVAVNTPPTASFVASKSVLAAGDTTVFDGTASFDPDGTPTPLSHAWDFGDGETRTGAIAEHSFAVPGVYDVALTVSDGTATDQLVLRIGVGTDALFADRFADGTRGDWSTQLKSGGVWLEGPSQILVGAAATTVAARGVGGADPIVFDDVSVGATMSIDSPGGWGGVVARKTSEQHGVTESGYLAFIRPGANGSVTLYRGGPGGSGMALATAPTGFDPAVAPVDLRLEAQGAELRVYANDQLALQVSDATYTSAGYAGLGSLGSRCVYDDLEVRSLAPHHVFGSSEPNSFALGAARIRAVGTPAAGTGFRIEVSGLNPGVTSGLLFSGDSARQVPGYYYGWFTWPTLPFKRHGLKVADATGTVTYELDLGDLNIAGVAPAPGETRAYQFQYRFQDPSNPDGLALSAALRVTFE